MRSPTSCTRKGIRRMPRSCETRWDSRIARARARTSRTPARARVGAMAWARPGVPVVPEAGGAVVARSAMNLDGVKAAISRCIRAADHPIVVGISGYAGSGKSTLARELVARIPGSVRLRGDDFLDPTRVHRRSTDWDGVERTRLVTEVLKPFREGAAGTFRRYDWSARRLGAPEPVPSGSVMIVDVIALFHPETAGFLDLRVWCDADLATAHRRGMARD